MASWHSNSEEKDCLLQICRFFLSPFVLVKCFSSQNNKCVDREWKVQGDGEEFRKKYGVPSGTLK